MCGISGIFGHPNKAIAENIVRVMNQCIAHRGPDAEGMWSNDQVVLGHRRLSIIDTSAAGNQPFFSSDQNVCLVFNGEIYNYLELRQELSGTYEFRTSSDTEVIIAAYLHWGIECISHFYGMFGFALWDNRKETLYVVRDRLGIKPIYYSQTPQGILFASEIRAILASGQVEKKISSKSLMEYIQYQTVHAPLTIIEGVQMIMPGHYLAMNRQGISSHCYWSPTESQSTIPPPTQLSEAHKHIHDLLRSSVALRMRADVPFGAFLSGGIDSGIIVGLMSEISSQPVNTFSVTFHEKEFDESPYSSQIAKKFNTRHTPIPLHASDFLRLVPNALEAMDHPGGDGPNTYVVAKVTRETGIKMALSGLGGDELFAGYDVFKRMKKLEQWHWLNYSPRLLRKMAGQLLAKAKPSVSTKKIAEMLACDRLDFCHAYPLVRQILSDESRNQLLHNTPGIHNPVAEIIQRIDQTSLPLLSKVSVAEITTYMQNVLLRDSDQMSMAHALEIRVPFLDHRLVEYALSIPDSMKYPHSPKQLLTESFGALLPAEVIHRPKMGFTFPWSVWMRGELRAFCEENLQALHQVESLNAHEVMQMWQRFIQHDPTITWSRLWHLVTLGYWVKQHDIH